jgi:hypothetical protein
MGLFRLITQNLLASAAQAISGTPTRTAVEDLASVINTVAMYDGLVVLGAPEVWAEYAKQSQLIEYLTASELLHVRRLDEATIQQVAKVSRLHLESATKAKDIPAMERFLEASYLARLCYPALIMNSDGHVDLAAGREWILTAPTGHDLDSLLKQDLEYSRSAYFYVRTFFYAAYMDIAKLDFTADRIRADVLGEISGRQASLQQDLVRKLQETFSQALMLPKLSSWLSPFAAVVFRACRGNRQELINQLSLIRDRVKPSREKLHELEIRFRYGPTRSQLDLLHLTGEPPPSSFAEAQRAYGEYLAARHILLADFGPIGQEVQTKGLLAFTANAALTAIIPSSPEAWMNTIASLPVENISSTLAHMRFAEIHQLKHDLPASAELLRSIEDLFGTEAIRENART